MSHLPLRAKAYSGLLLANCIIGFSFIVLKISLRHAAPLDLLTHRFWMGSLFIIGYLLFRKRGHLNLHCKNWKKLLLISLFYPLFFFLFQTLGMTKSTASIAGIIFAATPIFTLFFSSLLLRERTGRLQKTGIVMSVSGLVFMTLYLRMGHEAISLQGIVWLLLSVLSVVFYLIIGKKLEANYTPTELTISMMFTGCIAFGGADVVLHTLHNDWHAFLSPLTSWSFWWCMLYLGILSSVVTSYLNNYALHILPTTHISVFSNLSPIFSIVGGMLFLGETVRWPQVVGAALVIVGVLFTSQHEKNEN